MKILDLCEFYSDRGGGVRSYLGKLAHAASAAGHELTIVAPGSKDEVEHLADGAVLHRFKSPPMPYDPTYYFPWRVDVMRELVHAVRPDVMQVSSPFLPALTAATLRKVPLRVYVYHSDPIGCYLYPKTHGNLPPRLADLALAPAWALMRAVCNSSDLTVVAGEGLRRQLEEQRCERVHTVPFGITHPEFGPQRHDEELRQQFLGPLAGNDEARLLLITGRLAVDKRQAMVMEGIQQLAKKRPLAVVVLGDGPERPRLEEMARELPHATFLSFTRDRAEYARILASVDALAHGSLCETYGFILAETLCSGTPVVVPNYGAAAAFADPSCSEAYPALGGPSAVADALERVLNRDASAMRDSAVKVAHREPTMDNHFEQLFALYRSELERRGAASVA